MNVGILDQKNLQTRTLFTQWKVRDQTENAIRNLGFIWKVGGIWKVGQVCSRLKVQNTVFQPEFTSSKLTKETLKHVVKYVQN